MSRLAFGFDARMAMVRGARTLAKAVGCTIGPGGRVVLYEDRFGRVLATKDGATVARNVHLPDQLEHLGANLLADAALQVADEAGDGTSTCVVVAAELMAQATRLVVAGHNPGALAEEIEGAYRQVEARILAESVAIAGDHRLAALVAHVSGNGDANITKAVTAAYQHVGTDGVVLLSDGDTDHIEVDLETGFRIGKGWPGSDLAPTDGPTNVLEPAVAVLICARPIAGGNDILPILQAVAAKGAHLLVVCETLIDEALATVVGNSKNTAMKCAAVKPPGFKDRQWDFLHDLAVWCGGQVQDIDTGRLSADGLGWVSRVEQAKSFTMLHGPSDRSENQLRARTAHLQHIVDTTADDYDRDKAVERLGRLRGRIAAIRAGAPTAIEAREVKDRIEDALSAVRVAYRDGIQPGGGIALWRAGASLGFSQGSRCLHAATQAPARWILRNAGSGNEAFLAAIADERWAWGSDAYGVVCNMLSLPDPTDVVLRALRTAVSTVTTFLLAETAVLLTEDAAS